MLTAISKYLVAKHRISEGEPQHERSLNLGEYMFDEEFEIASEDHYSPKYFNMIIIL